MLNYQFYSSKQRFFRSPVYKNDFPDKNIKYCQALMRMTSHFIDHNAKNNKNVFQHRKLAQQ